MRSIDADRFVEYLKNKVDCFPDIKYFYYAIMDIAAQPTVDAVEVIRCSKCKYFCSTTELDKDGNITMEYNGVCMRKPDYFSSVVSDDYCSKAKRREDNETG
jgi:Pyruvate/2-oxoacid:ferredoxin oxidoreductase delta subunit